jgi:hypothetical protein
MNESSSQLVLSSGILRASEKKKKEHARGKGRKILLKCSAYHALSVELQLLPENGLEFAAVGMIISISRGSRINKHAVGSTL